MTTIAKFISAWEEMHKNRPACLEDDMVIFGLYNKDEHHTLTLGMLRQAVKDQESSTNLGWALEATRYQ